jgi:hypothetical protein
LRAFEAPIAHPQCAIAWQVRFEEIEEGEHRVVLTFADEDGNILMPRSDSTLAVSLFAGAADGAAGNGSSILVTAAVMRRAFGL